MSNRLVTLVGILASQPAIVLPAVFSFTVTLILLMLQGRQRFCRPLPTLSYDLPAFRALLSISTPTSLAQPSDLMRYLESTLRVRKPRRLEINLLQLLDNILEGEMELRDPRKICHLIKGQLYINDWSVELYTDTHWSIKVMKWAIEEQLFLRREYMHPSPKGPLYRNTQMTSDRLFPYFDLNCVPYFGLKAEIDRIKSLNMQAGSTITIEFANLAIPSGFSARHFMLCAVPFTPRRLAKVETERMPTALLIKTAEVISLFSTGPLMIESLTNISNEHANFLQVKEESLISDIHRRRKRIQAVGEAGWREERFILGLEAGLLLSGVLARWRLIVKKQEQLT